MEIDIKGLKDSNEFLNILLQHMDSAVFIADENLQIHQFNDSFLSLFNRPTSNLIDVTFGPASGCVNAVRENKPCGETSECKNCILRQSLVNTLVKEESNDKKFLERIFFINGLPVKKYLEFTSRPIIYRNQKMILVFVYDVTKMELSKIELERKQKQIDIDLEKAGEIQKNLLPRKLPDLPSVSVDWFFEPSLTIGGDIFHIYKETETHVSAYVLDVCGHGVSAALIAVTVKQFLDQLHAQGLAKGSPFQPGEILNALEAEFPFERFDCYFTIVYVLFDVLTGEASYGNAGHVPPLVVGKYGSLEVLDAHGTIIGLGPNPPQEQYTTRLLPGDKLVLYTDGLVDYFGKKGAGRNKDIFYDILKQGADGNAEQTVQNVVVEHRIRREKPAVDDDITLLVLEYHGESA